MKARAEVVGSGLFFDGPHPIENLRRPSLDVAQIVRLHGGVEPFENLVKAGGG